VPLSTSAEQNGVTSSIAANTRALSDGFSPQSTDLPRLQTCTHISPQRLEILLNRWPARICVDYDARKRLPTSTPGLNSKPSREDFWLIWFPCLLAAVVIAVLFLAGKLFAG